MAGMYVMSLSYGRLIKKSRYRQRRDDLFESFNNDAMGLAAKIDNLLYSNFV